MTNLLLSKTISEHYSNVDISESNFDLDKSIYFKNKRDCYCFEIINRKISTNYYIGLDWVVPNELAINIEPKLNNEDVNIDYIKMLFSCLKHSEIINYTNELYEIKFEEPKIKIQQQKDVITPLLVIEFLHCVKNIVRKGLKKSYYRVEENLNSKIKGKIIVSKTIKYNVLKCKPLYNVCSYEVFGVNTPENRLIKKAILFCQNYLNTFPDLKESVKPLIDFCLPSFIEVTDNIELNELKAIKINSFYKEYVTGIALSKKILKRFGYNIRNTEKKDVIEINPFWIDMAKLFELYVLGLLKDKYKNKIHFQVNGNYGNVDFLYKSDSDKIIIDTKYKKAYSTKYKIEDIRQLSGYARDKRLLRKLGLENDFEQDNSVVDCLIIYPNQDSELLLDNNLKNTPIKEFTKFYKLGIKLPEIYK